VKDREKKICGGGGGGRISSICTRIAQDKVVTHLAEIALKSKWMHSDCYP
jgi:hypothetical protein